MLHLVCNAMDNLVADSDNYPWIGAHIVRLFMSVSMLSISLHYINSSYVTFCKHCHGQFSRG